MPVASKRVLRVLHLVDEIDSQQGCDIDLDACKTDEEREFASVLQKRFDDAAQGKVELVSVAELLKRGHKELRRIETSRRSARPARRRSAVR